MKLQCISNGVTSFLHLPISIIIDYSQMPVSQLWVIRIDFFLFDQKGNTVVDTWSPTLYISTICVLMKFYSHFDNFPSMWGKLIQISYYWKNLFPLSVNYVFKFRVRTSGDILVLHKCFQYILFVVNICFNTQQYPMTPLWEFWIMSSDQKYMHNVY